jgi:hypothetical protein
MFPTRKAFQNAPRLVLLCGKVRFLFCRRRRVGSAPRLQCICDDKVATLKKQITDDFC